MKHRKPTLTLKYFPSLQAKELPTFKDNDFLNEGHKLQIGDDNKKYFLEKLKRDVEVRNAAGFHRVCCRIAQEALILLFVLSII